MHLRQVPAVEVKAMIGDSNELALLDVREEGVFDRGHPLYAVSLPLSQLELRMGPLCQRKDTRIVLMDGGSEDAPAAPGQRSLAYRAGRVLMRLGYTDVSIMTDGLAGWRAAGLEVFAGVNVPSKAFGEHVEHVHGTPSVEATELARWQADGRKLLVLDSRPFEEYRAVSIPGAIDCPGAELVHRAFSLVDSPETTVVVNCAGRTRSIIGAQSLIDAGLPNPVYALKNGTMGWHLAGLTPAKGASAMAAAPEGPGAAQARAAAARVASRHAVRTITHDAALRMIDEIRGTRTVQLLDVRTREEYEAGHLPGARHAPGGQLVQSTDHYTAVRNAVLLLACDDGTRSRMTASWLLRMGWREVFVIEDAMNAPFTRDAPVDTVARDALAQTGATTMIDCASLLAQMRGGSPPLIVDLDTSIRYRRAHIENAWWMIRARFAQRWPELLARSEAAAFTADAARGIVVAAADERLARLAAPELARVSGRRVAILQGGTRAWRAAGLPVESGGERMLDAPEDIWYRPYDRTEGLEQAMHQYLTWETGLLDQIARDGDAHFARP
jgi:rhodanese-related sulfurtransferase